jgi:hypothetical protein
MSHVPAISQHQNERGAQIGRKGRILQTPIRWKKAQHIGDYTFRAPLAARVQTLLDMAAGKRRTIYSTI